jgi:hypothetical protein
MMINHFHAGQRWVVSVSILVGTAVVCFLLGCLTAERIVIRQSYSVEEKAQIAYSDMRTLQLAIERYHAEYSKWPCANGATDRIYSSLDIIGALSGTDAILNPKGIAFLVGSSGTRINQYDDPWGNPYHIRFNRTLDVRLTNSGSKTAKESGVFIWSDGPGRIESWEPIPDSYLPPAVGSEENLQREGTKEQR